MAEFLVIRLNPDDSSQASWVAVDGDGTRRGPTVAGALADAASDVGDRTVIVLVPATEVATLSVDIPARGARLAAALPYALEDQVADDVERQHFAAGVRRDNGGLPVAVVARGKMAEWLALFEDAGIQVTKLIPENNGLALIPNTLSMLAAEGQVMFNDGVNVEFIMQGVKPSDALAAAGALPDSAGDDVSGASRHLLVYCEPDDEQRFEQDWNALRHELDSVDIHLLPDGVLPRLAVTVASGAGINLLQGEFGEQTAVGELFRPWRYAAALLLGLVLLGIAGKSVDNYRLGIEEAALKEQFITEYRQIRPDDTRDVVDPLGTVNSVRRGLGGADLVPQVFLPSLRQLAQALQQNPSADIEAISYRAGVVDVRLSAPDVETLDNIQRSVSASSRFKASIQSTDKVGDKVNSRIQIVEDGA
jgi:general secretion pathway protein L